MSKSELISMTLINSHKFTKLKLKARLLLKKNNSLAFNKFYLTGMGRLST